VTGGVCSSLGKGIAAASIGMLLKRSGLKVTMQKLDPYLNVDPGTMSPFQHGEVFVTDDGAETDMDLGHYERFIDEPLTTLSSVTTGKIYWQVLNKERRGEYLGKTIQIVPHITNAIKEAIRETAKKSNCDVMIVEIGGTVGDIEGLPFLEAARQLHREEGESNVLFVHLVLLPFLAASNEIKTKPAQMSVRELHGIGISPDILLARADHPIKDEHLQKLSLFCDVDREAVIPAPTIKTIYEVPLNFAKANMTKIIARKLKLKELKPKLDDWEKLVKVILEEKPALHIGLSGKYTSLEDAYISVIYAIKHACYHFKRRPMVHWIDTEKIEKNDKSEWNKLKKCDGIVVPGGFGVRGTEGKIKVAQYCRENQVPYLGLCLGAQIMTIEFARNVVGLKGATSEEFDPKAKHQVVHFLPGQSETRSKGGTLRLGSWPCQLKKGTLAYAAYAAKLIHERHRHRYEFNNHYREKLEKAGLIISGDSPDRKLMEIVEIKNHPFMLGSQFHPEFKSRPARPHPLFRKFVEVVMKKKEKGK